MPNERTIKAFDVDSNMHDYVGDVLSAGYGAMGRYINRMDSKELAHCSKMGLPLFLLYETKPTRDSYFTFGQGLIDAQAARVHQYLIKISDDFTKPIFFTVDYDSTAFEAIKSYYEGLRSVLIPAGCFLPGVYASGAVCKMLSEEGLTSFTCLSGSRGWTDYEEWVEQANIVQYENETEITLSGVTFDIDLDIFYPDRGGDPLWR